MTDQPKQPSDQSKVTDASLNKSQSDVKYPAEAGDEDWKLVIFGWIETRLGVRLVQENLGMVNILVDDMEHLIATHRRLLLDELEAEASEKPVYPGLEEYMQMVKAAEKGNRYDDMYDNAWKACDDQWRSLLAQKRGEL